MRPFLALLLVVFGLVCPARTEAHGMRTAYVEVVEHAPGRAIVRFRTSVETEAAPNFPAGCEIRKPLGNESAAPNQSSNVLVRDGSTYVMHCDGPLAGRTFGVNGLGETISEAVVWVTQSDGLTSSHMLTPAEGTLRIPARSSARMTFGEYVPLGARHIFSGADHLLFLLLLVLSLRKVKPVLIAETAFTLSHGLSFSAAALGWIHVSKEATEACIAMSLLLLALDVQRKDRPPPSDHSVALLALVFGLVHGLGFAGGMTELGMPAEHVGWALLGFGMGVEVGQIAFLAVALGFVYFLRRSR
ncbi:MAG TPA: HupE/UreJ family protein, partial [Polyangium sp.]|nr:HupE/UreJ family protein [Polyangium sp.]